MNHLTETVRQYVPKALRTELNPAEYVGDELVKRRLVHAAMGTVTEVAELAGGLDRDNELEELGDLAFYLAIATDVLNKKGLAVMVEEAPVLHSMVGDKSSNLLHLVRVAGDLMDFCKRWSYYNREPKWEDVQFTVQQLWQAAFRAVLLRESSIETVLQANVEKLRVRYPERFTCELAVQRDTTKERKVLEVHFKDKV